MVGTQRMSLGTSLKHADLKVVQVLDNPIHKRMLGVNVLTLESKSVNADVEPALTGKTEPKVAVNRIW